MTNAEIISVLSLVLAAVVPMLTSIFAYRQAISKIELDSKAQQDADENKHIELLAGVPKQSAEAFDTGSKALREVIEFLSKQITERDQRLESERNMFVSEIGSLRNEIRILTERVEDQSRGIELLTAQVESLELVPAYKKRTSVKSAS